MKSIPYISLVLMPFIADMVADMVMKNTCLDLPSILSLIVAVGAIFITVLIHTRGEYKSLGDRFEKLINEGKKVIHEEESSVINQLREELSKPEPDFEEIINLVNWISLLRGSLEECLTGFETARKRENQYLLGIMVVLLLLVLLASLVMFMSFSGIKIGGIEVSLITSLMLYSFVNAFYIDYRGTMKPLKNVEKAATQYFILRLKEES